MKGLKVLFAVTVFIACSVLLHGHTASAQAANGFNIVTSPVTLNLSGAPGTTISSEVRVKNNSSGKEKLKVSLMKFGAYGEEGKPTLEARGDHDDYFDWVSFTPSNFEAAPNEWTTVKVQIALPAESAFGYYYAIVFSRDAAVSSKPGENALVGSSAVLALVEAKVPNAKRSAQLLGFSSSKHWYEFLPAKFSARLRNDGNVHVMPQGNVFITKGGKNVATLSLNDAQGNILPGSNRIFQTEWKDGFPVYVPKEENGRTLTDGGGKVITRLKWEFSQLAKLRFGHYKARMVLAYDNGKSDVPIESTIDFWVMPWRIIAAIVFLIVLSITGAWTIGRWTGRHVRTHKKASP